ncbi:MAG: RagB/SusD family nutrient uptake outer membrane protein [Bacteroidales bacterium]|nr:RagB/SusD family nutrient uptake outer membrane protein [Bacteroidales bacterium]
MEKYIKSIISLSICMVFVFSFTSCDNDVLPTADTSADSYWRTERDAWLVLNNIYTTLTPGMGVYEDSYTDDVYSQYPWDGNGPIFLRDGLSAATGADWDFVGIRRVNDFLENVDRCDMNDGVRERMKAEARFLRAVNYLSKTLELGKVPIITTVLAPGTQNIERDSVEQVRQFIIDELREVSGILPDAYSGGYLQERGRATRYAALAYLSRAALLFGDYSLAESAARQVMAGPFSLFTISTLTAEQEKEAVEMEQYIDFDALGIDRDAFVRGMFSYESLWLPDYAGPENVEYIFSRQYAENQPDQENWIAYLALRPNQLGGWSATTPTQNLVNSYWSVTGEEPDLLSVSERANGFNQLYNEFLASGLTFSEFCEQKVADGTIKDYTFIQELRNRDSRLYASILLPFKGWFETVQGGDDFYYRWWPTNVPGNKSLSGYNFRKMTPLDRSSSGNDDGTADYPNFRYAEILLIFAEAHTHTTGYDGETRAALNEIRNRCGMPDVPTALSTDQALDLIRKERRIELAGEGARAMDLTRYSDSYWLNTLNNVPIVTPSGGILLTMRWSERMRLRPLPQEAIDRNPILGQDQNPGYQ